MDVYPHKSEFRFDPLLRPPRPPPPPCPPARFRPAAEAEASRCYPLIQRSFGSAPLPLKNWLDEEELGSWSGVKLTAASVGGLEQVQGLDFGGFGIVATMGRLARLFRCLTELNTLKLSGNTQLEGKVADVADMTALQVLNLSATKIGGELSAASELTCLTELVLDNSLVEGELLDLEVR